MLGSSRVTSYASNSKKTLYQILKVSRSATADEIKASYYKLAKEKHPDSHGQKPEFVSEFRQINQAYNLLKDPLKRKEYDSQTFTSDNKTKEYKFYDTQHHYGFNNHRTERKTHSSNSYHNNPFKEPNTNPYSFNENYRRSEDSQYSKYARHPGVDEFMQEAHRRNVEENRKIAREKQRKSTAMLYAAFGFVCTFLVGELIFKTYQFNALQKGRSYDERLDPRELRQIEADLRRGRRRDYLV